MIRRTFLALLASVLVPVKLCTTKMQAIRIFAFDLNRGPRPKEWFWSGQEAEMRARYEERGYTVLPGVERLEDRDCPSVFTASSQAYIIREPEINLFMPGATASDLNNDVKVVQAAIDNLPVLSSAYGIDGGRLVRTYGGPAIVGTGPGGTVTQQDASTYITSQFVGNGSLQNANAPNPMGKVEPDGRVHDQVYFLLLPQGQGINSQAAAYHSSFTYTSLLAPYAVCLWAPPDVLSIEVSHELDELALDSPLGFGYIADNTVTLPSGIVVHGGDEPDDPTGFNTDYRVDDLPMATALGPDGNKLLPASVVVGAPPGVRVSPEPTSVPHVPTPTSVFREAQEVYIDLVALHIVPDVDVFLLLVSDARRLALDEVALVTGGRL